MIRKVDLPRSVIPPSIATDYNRQNAIITNLIANYQRSVPFIESGDQIYVNDGALFNLDGSLYRSIGQTLVEGQKKNNLYIRMTPDLNGSILVPTYSYEPGVWDKTKQGFYDNGEVIAPYRYHYDPVNTIIETFSPGVGNIWGLAFDEVSGNLIYASQTSVIVCQGFTITPDYSFTPPGNNSQAAGLGTWEGNLYVISDFTPFSVYKMIGLTATVDVKLTSPYGSLPFYNVEWNGENMIIGPGTGNGSAAVVNWYDGFSSTVDRAVDYRSIFSPTIISNLVIWNGYDLFHLGANTAPVNDDLQLKWMDKETLSLKSTWTYTGYGLGRSGAFTGKNLMISGTVDDRIRVLDAKWRIFERNSIGTERELTL